MIKKIVIALVVVVAGVLLYAATKPDTLHVERSVTIAAPAGRIYPFISDFHSWTSWSPYERRDPAMKRSFGGATAGQGVDFIKPFEGHNRATFTMEPAANATKVTWAMDGPNQYVAKLMSVFMNMDAMIGNDFAAGLANLKALAEK